MPNHAEHEALVVEQFTRQAAPFAETPAHSDVIYRIILEHKGTIALFLSNDVPRPCTHTAEWGRMSPWMAPSSSEAPAPSPSSPCPRSSRHPPPRPRRLRPGRVLLPPADG